MPAAPTTPDLAQLTSNVQLPALPQSAVRLLQLSQDPNNGPAEFATPIEADPGLAGQVLKFVNSSYFGLARKVSNVKAAITLIGIRTIKNFTLWSAVFSLMPNPKCGPLQLKSLWQDSLRRAIFSRKFGKLMGMKEDAEDLFASALLQDLAIPLLAKDLPQQYIRLIEARGTTHRRLSELEQELFGWTHADAGEMIARKWCLPENFADLLASHTKLQELLENPDATKGSLAVALSSHLPAVCDAEWYDANIFMTAFERLAPLGCSVEKTLDEVDQGFAEFAPLLKLTAPTETLAKRCAELVTRTGQR